jgi:hypothetical protein
VSEKANAFNFFFSSVFKPRQDDPDVTKKRRTPEMTLTKEEVINQLKKLQTDKSKGPDGIEAVWLKECAEYIVEPLLETFQTSMAKGSCQKFGMKRLLCPSIRKGKEQMRKITDQYVSRHWSLN